VCERKGRSGRDGDDVVVPVAGCFGDQVFAVVSGGVGVFLVEDVFERERFVEVEWAGTSPVALCGALGDFLRVVCHVRKSVLELDCAIVCKDDYRILAELCADGFQVVEQGVCERSCHG